MGSKKGRKFVLGMNQGETAYQENKRVESSCGRKKKSSQEGWVRAPSKDAWGKSSADLAD